MIRIIATGGGVPSGFVESASRGTASTTQITQVARGYED